MKKHLLSGNCICGSGKTYQQCCARFLEAKASASTAEQLMRSRYTAFVLKDLEYITQTWLPATRPPVTSILSNNTVWTDLSVISVTQGQEEDREGWVEFEARYIEGDKHITIRETSWFIKKDNLWYYHSGNTDISAIQIKKSAPCPCGSGKKFKRCCLI